MNNLFCMVASALRCVLLLLVLRIGRTCDVCDGTAGRKVASGQVLDISEEGLHRIVPAHGMIALLIFRSSWSHRRTERVLLAFDEAATALRDANIPVVMAQIDARAFPAVTSTLRITENELPTIHVLRGDPTFSYRLRGGTAAREIMTELRTEADRSLSDSGVSHLSQEQLLTFEQESGQGTPTRVIANVSRLNSIRAVEQVAHAFHGAIRFARPDASPLAPNLLSLAAPLSPPPPLPAPQLSPPPWPPSPPSPPSPSSLPSPPSPLACTSDGERIILLREVSEYMSGEAQMLEMPSSMWVGSTALGTALGSPAGYLGPYLGTYLGTYLGAYTGSPAAPCGLTARQLHDWVRWAALPSVYALTAESAKTYLMDGASAVLFWPGASTSPKTKDYLVRRLRRLADRLHADGGDGLWLLWADSLDPRHARLRAQLGLPDASALTSSDQPAHSAAKEAVATAGSVPVGEFAIVVMAAGRVREAYNMGSEPFTFEAAHSHATDFISGRLRRAAVRSQIVWQVAQAATACASLAVAVGAWRRCRARTARKPHVE